MAGGEVSSPFWERLGKPRFVTAPMVEQSELPFRLLTRRYGSQLTYTPMLHARLFSEKASYRCEMFDPSPLDRPLIAHFCGDNEKTLVDACSHVEGHVDAVDINLGCPQGIARRGHYGAYLLSQPDLVASLVSSLVCNLPGRTPVTCKIRMVSDDYQQTLNLCMELEARGVSLICVHGRTKDQKSQLTGECDWDIIKLVKQRCSVPIIANGGIECLEDAIRCLSYTKADAVMSAEAILEYPALFSGTRHSRFCVKFAPTCDVCRAGATLPNGPGGGVFGPCATVSRL
eukprot:GHVS01032474.1.p1 GENE.GHVS01032474.1~~GHVS01032474.1.p1  ORF type:complete len:287 (+),score=4.42 GHVS01032474.1:28-888(+)